MVTGEAGRLTDLRMEVFSMVVAQIELEKLPSEVQTLVERVPSEYVHDLALDLAWAALIAPRRPDALHQVLHEWEITLEEIELAGDELPDIVRAREEAQTGVGMTPAELGAFLDSDADG
jgi:hypothetical protein